jgi:hypothetical protein
MQIEARAFGNFFSVTLELGFSQQALGQLYAGLFSAPLTLN